MIKNQDLCRKNVERKYQIITRCLYLCLKCELSYKKRVIMNNSFFIDLKFKKLLS